MGGRPRVLVDVCPLRGPAASSGIGTATRRLLEALVAAGDVDLTALVTGDVGLPDGVSRWEVSRVAPVGRAELMEHALRLPLDLRGVAGDVFYNPVFHAPWRVDRPYVQTLFDVIPLLLDDPDLAALRARWRRFAPRYRRADAVVAISRSAADDGIRLLGLDPRRVEVAHLGVGPEFTPGPVPSGPGSPGSPDPPFLVGVGEFSLRKGFAEACEVVARLAERGYPHRLTIAGRVQPWAAGPFETTLAGCRRPDRVDHLGFVDDVPALFRRASIFLSTSRYEGFGLPALEAMATGVPVVAFANSAVTEVVAGGGVLVPDGDVPAMAEAVHRLLESPAAWHEAREAGVARAAQFTWSSAAKAYADVFAAVARH